MSLSNLLTSGPNLPAAGRWRGPGGSLVRWLGAGAAGAIAALIVVRAGWLEPAPETGPPPIAAAVALPADGKSSAPPPAGFDGGAAPNQAEVGAIARPAAGKSSAPLTALAGAGAALHGTRDAPAAPELVAPGTVTPMSEEGLGDWVADWPKRRPSPASASAVREAEDAPLPARPANADALASSTPAARQVRDDDAARGTALDPLLSAIDRAVAIEQEEIAARIAKAEALHAAGDFDGAALATRDALANDPGNPRALRLYGRILVRERNFAAALEVLDAIIAADPDDEAAQLERATALLALGRPQDAAEAALVLGADAMAEISLLGRARAATGALGEAVASCNRIGSEFGDIAEMEWCFAAVQNQAGNHFMALQSFIATLNDGDAAFVRSKQVALRDAGLFDGPADGISDQRLIDAVAACAVARDCIL